MVDITEKQRQRLAKVDGVDQVGSLAAAALLACGAHPDLASAGLVRSTIVSRCVGGHVPVARRAASALAHIGAHELIGLLPLSATELSWWQAIANLEHGGSNQAIDLLSTLKAGRYPGAIAALVAARRSADVTHQALAGQLIDTRLKGIPTAHLAAEVWPGNAEGWRWLDDDTAPVPRAETPTGDPPAVSFGRFVLGRKPYARTLPHVPGVAPALIDDAIDLGGRFSDFALDQLSPGNRVAMLARSNPTVLTDDELTTAGLTTELARRRLHAISAGFDVSPIGAGDPRVNALMDLATGKAFNADAVGPDAGPALHAFVASPDLDHLTADLVADQSLWIALSRRLQVELDSANPTAPIMRFLAWHALRTTSEALFDADWERATQLAKHVLRWTSDETLRDEALNLLACAQWQLGHDDAALRALEDALRGDRNPSLQVNLSVVAGSTDPETAALELARLVREAGSLELRVSAGMRAVDLWLTDEVPWISERERGMPEALTVALRSLVVEPIEIDAFRRIAKLMSMFDDDWFEKPANIARSPHRATIEAQVYQARAAGPAPLVDALIAAMRRSATPADWVVSERDELLNTIVRHSLGSSSSSAAFFAHVALDRGLPVEPRQRDVLVPLAVIGICQVLSDENENAAPNDSFTNLLRDGERAAKERGNYDDLDAFYISAWMRLAVAHCAFSQSLLAEAAQAFDNIANRIGHIPKRRLNMTAVRSSVSPIRDAAREVERTLVQFQPYVTDEDIQAYLTHVIGNARLLRTESERLMS